MDLNKLALLNSIAQEKAELEKKSRSVKREIDFIELTKSYTEIIENLIYSCAQQCKKTLDLWVKQSDNDNRVYVEQRNSRTEYIITGMRVEYNIYVGGWKEFDSQGDEDKLQLVNTRYSHVPISALAFMNAINMLKEQGFEIDIYSYIASGTSVGVKWKNISYNEGYKEDNYDILKLKKKYERLKELNNMANNIIAE